MALSAEAGELLEVFQWLTDEQSKRLSPEALAAADEEIADVLLYLIRLSDKLGIDPIDAARRKLLANAARYPADKARGNARKYTELSWPIFPAIHWSEGGETRSARWRSERGTPPPKRVVIADDSMTADAAYRLACEGTALLWRGDFQNARQLLHALARRADRKPRKPHGSGAGIARRRLPPASPGAFAARAHAGHAADSAGGRLQHPAAARARRAAGLQGSLRPGGRRVGRVAARTAGPDRRARVAQEGHGDPGAGGRIHPHYGVFAPVRSEYVELVADAPLPASCRRAGLRHRHRHRRARRGAGAARRRSASSPPNRTRARWPARARTSRGSAWQQVEVVQADLFPEGRAPLIVCNPPWIPARPSSPLRTRHLRPGEPHAARIHRRPRRASGTGGEGWLVLSDIAEHLGLRTRAELLAAFDAAGLKVVGRIDVRPHHPGIRRHRPAARRARGGGDFAVAACPALTA